MIVPRCEEEDLESIYYTDAEYDRMRDSDQEIIHQVFRNRKLNDDHHYCIRGLEGKTPQARISRKLARDDAIFAVLDEQWYQRQEKSSNPELISKIYQNYSVMAREAAQWMAKMDAKFVVQDNLGRRSALAFATTNDSIATTTTMPKARLRSILRHTSTSGVTIEMTNKLAIAPPMQKPKLPTKKRSARSVSSSTIRTPTRMGIPQVTNSPSSSQQVPKKLKNLVQKMMVKTTTSPKPRSFRRNKKLTPVQVS